jgi:Na+/H+ antiporter NhaA
VAGRAAALPAPRHGTGGEAARGWGIAISTDTAFALGVLALVVPRCPNRLRLFLLAPSSTMSSPSA